MSRLHPLIFLVCAFASGTAAAQEPAPSATPAYNITLVDGRVIPVIGLKRDGANVQAFQALPAAPGVAPVVGHVGYPLKAIKRIDFPEPEEMKAATDLLAQGKPIDALERVTPAVAFYDGFADIPGNHWADLALLKLNALVQAHRDVEAETLAERLMRSSSDPEAIFSARLQIAANWIRKNEVAKANAVFDEVIQKSKADKNLALAWLRKGDALMASQQAESALLAYLRVPVLYPDQTLLMPGALLGSMRAYAAMGDGENAARARQDILDSYPNSPEAAAVKAEAAKN